MKEWSPVAKNTLKQALVDSVEEEDVRVNASDDTSEVHVPAAPKRTRTVKVVEADDRCMARVWGGGCGAQCKRAKCEGSDYCKHHGNKAAVTTEPVQFDEDGNKIGLFWDRIDQPLPIFNNGQIAVRWTKDEEARAKADNALKEGKTYHPFSGEMKKKNRKSSSGIKKKDGHQVKKHILADGSKVLKSDDGTLYDPTSWLLIPYGNKIGKWDEETNSLISA